MRTLTTFISTVVFSLTVAHGAVFSGANIQVQAGSSKSNAWVGGMITHSNVDYTNHNALAQLTNLATCIIAAGTLEHIGDSITATWCGKFANAKPGTNRFVMNYANQTFLDTGLQPMSNGAFYATINLTSVAPNQQHAQGWFTWQAGPTTVFGQTNINVELGANNAVDNLLAMQGACRRIGGFTNNALRVYYEPAVR